MLRTAMKASSLLRRLAGAASTGRPTLLIPAISPAFPYHPNLIQTSLLFTPILLCQFRGFAPGPRAPEEDDDFSDDSEDFEIGGGDFTGDEEEEGITDGDSLDEDEVEGESD